MATLRKAEKPRLSCWIWWNTAGVSIAAPDARLPSTAKDDLESVRANFVRWVRPLARSSSEAYYPGPGACYRATRLVTTTRERFPHLWSSP